MCLPKGTLRQAAACKDPETQKIEIPRTPTPQVLLLFFVGVGGGGAVVVDGCMHKTAVHKMCVAVRGCRALWN